MNEGRQQRDLEQRLAPRVDWNGNPRAGMSPVHLYAGFVAASILVLICSGGLVTSKGAGLAVPDWPNTYGYNVFAFPFSRWVGGVLFEHVHRLIASAVGLLTLGLTVWLGLTERRPWVRNLGYAALIAVMVQAVLGGLRVVELNAAFGLFHACLAQAFLALVALIALVTSRGWDRLSALALPPASRAALGVLSKTMAAIVVCIYIQLGIGATMRHAHTGLSIPDFPTAYGQAWPRIDAARLAQINRQRDQVLHLPPTTLAQIHLQMGHRMMAGVILGLVCVAAVLTWNRGTLMPASVRRLGLVGPWLIACQVALGIATIWTNKAADVATTHVALGALSLVWSVLTYALLRRCITSGASLGVRGRAATASLKPPQEVAV